VVKIEEFDEKRVMELEKRKLIVTKIHEIFYSLTN